MGKLENTEQIIAHINDKGQEQTLKAHLEGTARKACTFAEEFGCGEAAKLCGLLHDIGKNSQEFQKRIRNPLPSNRVDHSTAGALEVEKINQEFTPFGMVIAGHHSGLMDGGNLKTATAGNGTYFGRRKNCIPDYHMPELKEMLKDIWPVNPVSLPMFCRENRFSMSFFIRMLYSCLVDADFLDTEEFMQGQQSMRGGYDSPKVLLGKFQDYVETHFFKLAGGGKLCNARNEILRECMQKGESYNLGLYTLTVPTGGGKTIASLGFALQHIVRHSMKRIIYVIPYTSVIDQNAQVFEGILGE
ncbi:MAG: CRISPR-associated endonuclease Cas3'' [Lachnospiraceae bacterium]|nr:CRISPR-associated endonuclease Cas3'' [Lachnospiraceae bacterium]